MNQHNRAGAANKENTIPRLTPLVNPRQHDKPKGTGAQPSSSSSSSSSASSQEQQRNQQQLCRFFVLHGNCRYGESCHFSHTLPLGVSMEDAKKQVPCPFFAKGYCKYGDFCQLRHDANDLLNVAKLNETKTTTTAAAAAATTTATSSSISSTTEVCGICLEPASQKNNSKFGLLSGCNHVFCFDCLMEWRKQGSEEAKDRRSCPTCRIRSDYVVPSKQFPSCDEEKQAIVSAYKRSLAKIPCKHYIPGRSGSCIFGRDCFYAHLGTDGQDRKDSDESMEELLERRRRKRSRTRMPLSDDELDRINAHLFLLSLETFGYREFLIEDDDDDDDDESQYWQVLFHPSFFPPYFFDT